MKKIIIWTVLLAFSTTSFCQQTVQKQQLVKSDYFKKSKKQKTNAWILVAGGAALFTISAVIPKGELTDEISYPCLCQDVYKNDIIKSAIGLAGAVSALGSIPFFIASGKNKKKAMSASAFIKMERLPVLQYAEIRNQSFPALVLRFWL